MMNDWLKLARSGGGRDGRNTVYRTGCCEQIRVPINLQLNSYPPMWPKSDRSRSGATVDHDPASERRTEGAASDNFGSAAV